MKLSADTHSAPMATLSQPSSEDEIRPSSGKASNMHAFKLKATHKVAVSFQQEVEHAKLLNASHKLEGFF